ncbi:translation initiation factor [Corallincola spongiicola]|uniref:SUI1 domain-containing protein n=1 Tax=Corallincola spongiicola TaxID=2520508 RepID=A0ABY1WTL1_9GAMM|nr:hypothetical protein [Corallincola spongiicola]TAA48073.1 hypothetical protein EXY25_02190 [Corallincola spongiicola]
MSKKLSSFADLAALTGQAAPSTVSTNESQQDLVYSTDGGRVVTQKHVDTTAIIGDGRVRISRSTKGRGGKTVSVVTGLALTHSDLQKLCKTLKKQLGCGGVVRNGELEFQGDKRDLLLNELTKAGYQAKLSGG